VKCSHPLKVGFYSVAVTLATSLGLLANVKKLTDAVKCNGDAEEMQRSRQQVRQALELPKGSQQNFKHVKILLPLLTPMLVTFIVGSVVFPR